jgi:L-fuculose-phosphate aldolase
MGTRNERQVAAARTRVHEACLRLVVDRLVVGSAGNVSERIDAERFVVSPGGRLYEELQAEDYPLVDIPSGEAVSGLPPTSELALHQALYQAFPDVQAVVHTHSRYAAAFAVARVDLPFVCNENIGPGSEKVLVTDPYAAPGTTDLGTQAVRTFARQPGSRAVLLANHGVVALGASVSKAYLIAAQVEWIAEVTHHAATLDPNLRGVVTIPHDQQDLIGTNYAFSVARQQPARADASRTRKRSAAPRSR